MWLRSFIAVLLVAIADASTLEAEAELSARMHAMSCPTYMTVCGCIIFLLPDACTAPTPKNCRNWVKGDTKNMQKIW